MFVFRIPKVPGIKPREFEAVKVCRANIHNTVSQLQISIKEFDLMDKVKVQDFVWHLSNVQTWVSAALTYENTCLHGLFYIYHGVPCSIHLLRLNTVVKGTQ